MIFKISLSIKHKYIDSRVKTQDSKSKSNLTFELKLSLQLLDNCVCYMDDIAIPHTWYTIEDLNNELHDSEYESGVCCYRQNTNNCRSNLDR